MKNKINRKALQAKLNHSIGGFVKLITDSDSKKINKSIKKASKIIAKAITKEINESMALHPIEKKSIVPPKRIVKIQAKVKASKRLSFPRVIHKVNKQAPVKFSQKTHEETLGFAGKDGHDKSVQKI